ncbi:hypothetical protein B0H14DRAFT_217308 [Mycena olivaceomarginata]|nr:hypothetical protein B0H14DRAFT_217308 [Mycena olivaceomarginata]
MARSTSAQAASKPEASSNTTCEHCGVTVKRPTDLPRHMLIHAPNKEEFMYTCPIEGCSHQTLQRSNLNTHIRTHTRTRPYSCPEHHPNWPKVPFYNRRSLFAASPQEEEARLQASVHDSLQRTSSVWEWRAREIRRV